MAAHIPRRSGGDQGPKGLLWLPAADATITALQAAAAAARAGGCVEASASLVALAASARAIVNAAALMGTAVSADDPEIEARTQAARTCILEQVAAARRGQQCSRPRDVLDGGQVALRNVAVHDFGIGPEFATLTAAGAKRRQRGGKRRQSGRDKDAKAEKGEVEAPEEVAAMKDGVYEQAPVEEPANDDLVYEEAPVEEATTEGVV